MIMPRRCYDSTNAADVPIDTDIVCGYINGSFKWSDADWARFPGKPQVRISVNAQTDDGNCLDVESGDAYPTEAPMWVKMRRAAGVDPTCYVNLQNWQLVKDAFAAYQIPEPHYWLAHYDNVATIPDGCVAKQYANEPLTGGHYDASVCADYWPGVDPAQGEGPMTDTQMAELKAFIEAQTNVTVQAAIAIALRQMRGANPGIAGHDAPIVAGEQIFPSNGKG